MAQWNLSVLNGKCEVPDELVFALFNNLSDDVASLLALALASVPTWRVFHKTPVFSRLRESINEGKAVVFLALSSFPLPLQRSPLQVLRPRFFDTQWPWVEKENYLWPHAYELDELVFREFGLTFRFLWRGVVTNCGGS